MNDGLRITLDRRGRLFYWTLTEHGQEHSSSRGYTTLVEAVEQADLYRQALKFGRWREKEKRLAENQ